MPRPFKTAQSTVSDRKPALCIQASPTPMYTDRSFETEKIQMDICDIYDNSPILIKIVLLSMPFTKFTLTSMAYSTNQVTILICMDLILISHKKILLRRNTRRVRTFLLFFTVYCSELCDMISAGKRGICWSGINVFFLLLSLF